MIFPQKEAKYVLYIIRDRSAHNHHVTRHMFGCPANQPVERVKEGEEQLDNSTFVFCLFCGEDRHVHGACMHVRMFHYRLRFTFRGPLI
jgi:hypothetical protein